MLTSSIPRKKTIEDIEIRDRSCMAVLEDYCNFILDGAVPRYADIINDDPKFPFQSTCFIGGKEYGVGKYSSKKQAQQIAAYKTLEELSPGLFPRENLYNQVLEPPKG